MKEHKNCVSLIGVIGAPPLTPDLLGLGVHPQGGKPTAIAVDVSSIPREVVAELQPGDLVEVEGELHFRVLSKQRRGYAGVHVVAAKWLHRLEPAQVA